MNRRDAKTFTRSLMASAPCVYVATVDEEGLPHIRAVSNLRDKRQYPGLEGFFREVENPFVTYLATSAASSKARQLRLNARAALYFCQPERFFGLMLSGSMEVVKDRDVKRRLWQTAWKAFWPRGPADPRYAVYRFLPDGAKGWSGEELFRFPIRAPSP